MEDSANGPEKAGLVRQGVNAKKGGSQRQIKKVLQNGLCAQLVKASHTPSRMKTEHRLTNGFAQTCDTEAT